MENSVVAKNERLAYADILRVVASFAVILLHVCGNNWISEDIYSLNWQVLNVYDSAVRWCVPVFVMLSGMFMLDPARKVTYKSLFSKNLLRIATAFVFWSVLYGAWTALELARAGTPETMTQIVESVVYGHYHLWFLYMIMGLYLITPIVRKFIEASSRRDIEYFLLLFVAFTIVSPALSGLPGVKIISNVAYRLDFKMVTGYVGYFLAGYYFKTYDFSPTVKRLIYAAGIIGFVATIGLTWVDSVAWAAPNEKWYLYFAPNVALMSAAVFLFFKEHVQGKRLKPRTLKVINSISACSFGIYLIHAFINAQFANNGLTAVTGSPFLAAPLISVAIMAIGYFVILLFSKIPLFKKYLM